MKKKILFLLLLLLPFMVKALDIQNLNQKWKMEETENAYKYAYKTDKTFIYASYDTMVSVDKLTGEKTEIAIPDNSMHALVGNHMFVLSESEMSESYTVRIYDEYLNYVDKFFIRDFYFMSANVYKNDYFLLVGYEYSNEPNFDLTARFYDQNGNLVRSEQFPLRNGVSPRSVTNYMSFFPDTVFVDFNNNSFKINDSFEIEPLFKNSDGSYMYLTNDHLYKYSSTHEEIDSLEIPNGKGTRMIKKDNKYYIATGVYETDSTSKTSVGLNLYIVDENLNVIKTGSIEAPETKTIRSPYESGYDYNTHSIYYNEDTDELIAYINIYNDSNKYSRYAYTIDDNLGATERENPFYPPYYHYAINVSLNGFPGMLLRSIRDFENYDLEELNSQYEILNEKYKDDEYFMYIRTSSIGNTFAILEEFEKCEGPGCDNDFNDDYKRYRKTDLVYLDSNYNELFRKTIFDWYLDFEYDYETGTSIHGISQNTIVETIDDKIALLSTGSQGKIFYIFDKQGNVVKDLTDDLNPYANFMAADMFTTDKGLYVSLLCEDYNSYTFGASEWSHGGAAFDKKKEIGSLPGLPEGGPENGIYSVIMYYSINFEVAKQINGKGTINSTVERADVGEVVRFTVTPDPGFVLGVVKVTDANGNVLTFTNNTFVMPASDVIIEASFVPLNPNTGDIAILVIVLIAIASATILITQKKKLDFLK